jgi:hypothetical protein
MVKATEDRPSSDLAKPLNRTMGGCILVEGQMGSEIVVQQGSRTPTGLAFVIFCIDGIRGLAFGFASMGRSTRPVVLYSVAR